MGILLQAQTTTTTEQDNFMDMLSNMGIGGNIVMAVLLLLSILAIYILVERYFAIRKESLEDEDFLMSIRKFVEEKNIDQAKKLCKNTDSPISRMIEKGLDRIDKPMTDISSAIENQGKLEIYKMDNKIENLLEKYEEGQTTLQEETQLKHYFTTQTVVPHLEVYRSLFNYYVSDKQLYCQRPLPATPSTTNKYRWFASAAVVTIMFSAFMTLTSKNESIKLSNEEQFAYNESLKAFDLISSHMHKAAAPLNALNIISNSFEKGQQNVAFLEEFNNSTNKIFNIK